jgi:excisionase family DNA binding protein
VKADACAGRARPEYDREALTRIGAAVVELVDAFAAVIPTAQLVPPTHEPHTNPQLISRAKAAEMLGVSIDVIKRLIAEDELISVPVRGRRLIDSSSLDSFISRRILHDDAPYYAAQLQIRKTNREV